MSFIIIILLCTFKKLHTITSFLLLIAEVVLHKAGQIPPVLLVPIEVKECFRNCGGCQLHLGRHVDVQGFPVYLIISGYFPAMLLPYNEPYTYGVRTRPATWLSSKPRSAFRVQRITRAQAGEERQGIIVPFADLVENSVFIDISAIVAYNVNSIFATNGPFSWRRSHIVK